ncbi:dTDP-4-dehydrorhamnose reductase [Winogradskyella echinorum]|uniref:dTDP-4-dehydrorhamnose reductase n=1 Tax=Winogradskyella echinorum TaxID=538189 RepID=A0ABR6XZ16_9FLAO|nr:dTDP-4-dehydrorhamnose reductase [Winogradskyella echinorum]MBC3845743.1 dTDP-4-dehydrorhamnose reductase [Winogradskyella echinorum]MBC5750091.1 dTDP-4-dehydrorhamnose reductase [Winogradskyella echinorum]
MKKIVVLGANGQLGKTIKNLDEFDGVEFHFFSRVDLDITDKNKLATILANAGFDYCINCAAYTNVENAEENTEEAFKINAEGARNIAEVCNTNGIKLIHISTDYVFDGKNKEPYTVNDITNPINEYGKSKLQGELYIKEELDHYYIIRTSWLYSLYGKNFLKTVIGKIENDEVLNITTEEEGTPTSCIDLSEFILHIIKEDTLPYGIYHFSANGSTTWYGFAKEIVRNFKPEKLDNIKPIEKFKTRAKRPNYSVLDLNKTEEFYKELLSWEENLRFVFKSYKNK